MRRAEPVAEDTWIIRTPLPGHSFGCLNSYLVAGRDGIAVIDAPWSRPEVVEAFERGVRETGHEAADIDLVLLTHYHEDHSGAAGTLHRKHGARIGIHPADAEVLRWRAGDGAEFRRRLDAWLAEAGVDDPTTRFAREQFDELQGFGDTIDADVDLVDGRCIDLGGRTLEVMHIPGHTRGHIALIDPQQRLAFTGDHVFPRRRANATARPVAAARPIGDYWRSMERLLAVNPRLTLPGHEEPFEGLQRRAAELRRIRDVKLAEIVALAGETTAWTIAQQVRRRRHWSQLDPNARLAAAGEAFAYLLEAEADDQVQRIGAEAATSWRRVEPQTIRRRLVP